jgi:prolipoprotein diacylglyceryltransferase
MFPIIQIGPLALQAPGLFLLIGLWIGLTISERLAVRFNARSNHIYNIVFVALIAGLVGARLSYALQHVEAFLASPMSLFSLNPGLLDPLGGIAVGLVAATIYGNRKQIPLWPTLDALTPLLAVMIMAVGLANLASGSAFGVPTQMPWGIELWGLTRHPTQIYQIIAGAVILGLIWPRRSDSGASQRVPGETFWLFLVLSSVSWMIIEAFRGDSVLLPGGWREAQIIAWVVLAISLLGLWKTKSHLESAAKNM